MPDFSVITQYVVYIATIAGATFGLIKGTLNLTEFLAILGSLSLGHATATTVANKRLNTLVRTAIIAPTTDVHPPVVRDPLPPESVPAQ